MPIYSADARHYSGSLNARSGCSFPSSSSSLNSLGNPFCTSETDAMLPPVTPYCPQQETPSCPPDPDDQPESCAPNDRACIGLSAFATGYAAGSIRFGEDQPAIFPMFSSQKPGDIPEQSGVFTLAKPGTYQITALVNIPTGETMEAVLHLTANGEIIPGSVTRVSPSRAGTYVMTAVVISDGTVTVALTASQTLSLVGVNPSDVLASITFLRLA